MFTGIVQGVAQVQTVVPRTGLHTLTLTFPIGFAQGLALGASVAVDGVCLTVTRLHVSDASGVCTAADFDVMQQTLSLTTLGTLRPGARVNVERAAAAGAEVGGHVLSGHVDCTAQVLAVRQPPNNHVLRIGPEPGWMRYLFAKGFVAINGASLTLAEVNRSEGWFEVWLIPETLRMTTFGAKQVGDTLNLEIERSTQVLVDSVQQAVHEQLGPLLPALQAFARERGLPLPGLGALGPGDAQP